MRNLTLSAIFIAALMSLSTNVNSQWNQVFSDEFNYSGYADDYKWTYEHGPNWYNGELQYYTNRRLENCRIDGNTMVIQAREESYGGKSFTSARVRSKQSWTYGKFEIRAKLTEGTALWPAIWMLPVNEIYGGWPASGEIDIMENWSWNPDGIYGTIHTTRYNHIDGTEKQGLKYVWDPSAHYHKYSIIWGPDRIDWFIDDNWYFGFNNEGWSGAWPFDHNFYLLLNVAVEKNAWGQTYTWNNPVMNVDYVRVYQWGGTKAAISSDMYIVDNSIEITTYPNPAADYINISGIEDAKYLIKIYNTSGSEVKAELIEGSGQSIAVGELPSGMYLVNIYGNNIDETIKFVKD